jgi:hypothetical protein
VAEKIRGNDDFKFGYNAATGVYEDLVAAGVVDPCKVTRTALQNAGSVRGLLLTTDALVSEIKEDKRQPRPAPAWAAWAAAWASNQPPNRIRLHVRPPRRPGSAVSRVSEPVVLSGLWRSRGVRNSSRIPLPAVAPIAAPPDGAAPDPPGSSAGRERRLRRSKRRGAASRRRRRCAHGHRRAQNAPRAPNLRHRAGRSGFVPLLVGFRSCRLCGTGVTMNKTIPVVLASILVSAVISGGVAMAALTLFAPPPPPEADAGADDSAVDDLENALAALRAEVDALSRRRVSDVRPAAGRPRQK